MTRARLAFVDVARALAVLGMLVANLVNVFLADRPRWLAHNLGDELLPLDLPAPFFQLLVGVSLALFLVRQREAGAAHARMLAIRRFGLLIVLGVMLDGALAGRLEMRWGVLQTLGTGGLLATAAARVPDAALLAGAGLITAIHYGPSNNEVHRAMLDCLPFLPLTLVGYVLGRPLAAGERARFRRRAYAIGTAAVVVAIVLRLAGIAFNKVTGSSSFVVLAIGLGTLTLAVLHDLEAVWTVPPWLVLLGANALTAWVLQYVVVYYPLQLLVPTLPAIPANAGALLVLTIIVVLTLLTLALARRGVRVPL